MKTRFLFLSTAILLLAGCAKELVIEPIETDSSLIPLNISGSINQVQTKATASGFVDKDALGLYAVNYSDNNTIAGTLLTEGNQADNVKYVFDEAAYKWNPIKSVYYKDINTNVDLYLYYPYQSSISDVSSAGFEVRKDQSAASTATSLSGYEASDFLWGKAENITPSESRVAVSLSHRMSAVNVTLVAKSGFEDGEFESIAKSVITTNTTRKATIDYATGVVTALGEPQQDGIVMCPQEEGSFRAIVVPQTVNAGVQLFAITIDGISYSFRTSASSVEYKPGKQLDFTINITKKNPEGEYELELGDLQINEWREDRNAHGGEARQYYVVTLTEPGTLRSTLEAAGKNPAKIRNLKVVGPIDGKDFACMNINMELLSAVNLKEADCKKIPENAFLHKKNLAYFVFPENITSIGYGAFSDTNFSGPLILPDGIVTIGQDAFRSTLISSVVFPEGLKSIGHNAFSECSSLTGSLLIPDSVENIGVNAFKHCKFNGKLSLSANLQDLAPDAFMDCGMFQCDLVIPESVKAIYGLAFQRTKFSGRLIFEGSPKFLSDYNKDGVQVGIYGDHGAFMYCDLHGELVIPDGLATIPQGMFEGNHFTSVILPSTLQSIGPAVFRNNDFCQPIVFPKGLISIGAGAFYGCYFLPGIELPETLQSIQSYAFQNCRSLSSITCHSIEPPTLLDQVFDGVAKDNFTVEVPEQSVKRYRAESGWNDFKRIGAHHDFSLGRNRIRLLNKGGQKTMTLRCPANYDWTVSHCPDWVQVSPSHGTGKTDVTITIADMARTTEQFELNLGDPTYPSYAKYRGRNCDVVFTLSEKNYDFSLSVEQFDCDYADGDVILKQSAVKGKGIDIVFIGEGFDAKDIADGSFNQWTNSGAKYLFDVEPYKSYKDYFNISAIITLSEESGIETVNTIIENRFIENGILDVDKAFAWAKHAKNELNLQKSVVVLLENVHQYSGGTYMYGDGSALSVVPLSYEAYPYDFRGLIQHEVGGHAFGKLGDEYIYHNAYITSCGCQCCKHDMSYYKSLGWYKNLSTTSDHTKVPWAHLLYNPKYSNYVDMFEGGYMHTRGVYRSEVTSCMNNNIPYYNAISRQAIVERIMECAGEEFTLEKFYANDDDSFGTITKSSVVDRTFGVDPSWNRGPEHGSVIYMGEHPNIK